MTTTEKYTAIIERLKDLGKEMAPVNLSLMMINGYIEVLYKNGIVTAGQYAVTPRGKAVIALCEEFDWRPSDGDIISFVRTMVEPEEQAAFAHLIIRVRDDREKLLSEYKKFIDNSDLDSESP